MPLSEEQIDTVFEIMDIPRSTTVEQPIGTMNLSAQTFQESNPEFQLQLKVEQRIASLSTSNQTRLIIMTDRWDALGTQDWVLDGGAGSINGISMAPQREGAEIQRRTKRLIGVYRMVEEIENKAADNNDGFISVLT